MGGGEGLGVLLQGDVSVERGTFTTMNTTADVKRDRNQVTGIKSQESSHKNPESHKNQEMNPESKEKSTKKTVVSE